ncbi:sugar phosphate isomerase/epimerase [Rubellimicrobium sp. CFH 75288]|uniref:sugar phosphate isomerase/epimerase family protein n=1 Tax=Rubellimicrobium sp. CFH 75288 TaxID=2697034 RepID=UPI001412888F|nr:sugar phosphate isomerase/epimerase [Rubellimicrobium sp. CFH 75288]NAZ38134.1 TIM barrel protein [Rubellimicrobium sp. CFH 75288]
MRLSLTSWSFPALTLPEVAQVARALGVGAIDTGYFYRAALDREEVLSDPLAAAERLRGLGVDVANHYHLWGRDLADRNLALPDMGEAQIRDLEAVLRFAEAANIPTVFVLPGLVNPGQSRREAARTAAHNIRRLLDVPGARARLCIEPHVHSWAESPDLVRELVEETGVRLALDYAHFLCLGYRQEEVDPLAPHAAHVHLRQARPGLLQAKFAKGTINFPALFGTLREAGYDGALALEAVHQDYMDTLHDDVMTETVALRDAFRLWAEGG